MSGGNTHVLSLRRTTMEAKLGPLQSVIDQAGVRMAKGEAMKEFNEGLVASLQVFLLLLCYTANRVYPIILSMRCRKSLPFVLVSCR